MSVIMSLFRRKSRVEQPDVRDGIYQAAKEAYWNGIIEAKKMKLKVADRVINNLCHDFRKSTFTGKRYLNRRSVQRTMMRLCIDEDTPMAHLDDRQIEDVLKKVAAFFKSKGFAVTLSFDNFDVADEVKISLQEFDME